MLLPRNIPKKITKSYSFRTFFNFLFVIYMYNFLKVTSAVRFIICYYQLNTDVFCSYFYEKNPKTCTLPDFVLLATSYPLTWWQRTFTKCPFKDHEIGWQKFRETLWLSQLNATLMSHTFKVLSGVGQSETKLAR